MKATDNLFQLIKSLTGNEKRYFKILSKRHVVGKINKYEVLFDLYDAQPSDTEYDEDHFKKSLKGKGLGKNLADEKKNLQEMIMKAMRAYHSETSINNQLNDLLAEETFYRKKRLNDLRRKAIDKAKGIAEKYEKYTVLLDLLERETIMRIELDQDRLEEIAANIGEDQQRQIDLICITSKLWALNNWLFIQYRINANKTADFWKVADEKLADPVFATYKPGLCYNADRHYYKIKALYTMMKGDYEAHDEYSRLINDLYETKYPLQKSDNRIQYKISIYNRLHSLKLIEGYEEMEKLLNHARKILPQDDDEAGEDFQNTVIYRQLLYMNTLQFEKAIAMVPEIKKGIKRYSNKINKSSLIVIYNNISASYLVLEEWQEVLDYTELILSDKTDVRMDVKYRNMLFQLLSHYELGNYDLLIYQLRNTERLLKKRGVCQDSEIAFFKLLNQLLKHGNGYLKERKEEAEAYLNLLANHEELRLWLQSRLTRKTIQQTMAESA
jgi:hypothetical protein